MQNNRFHEMDGNSCIIYLDRIWTSGESGVHTGYNLIFWSPKDWSPRKIFVLIFEQIINGRFVTVKRVFFFQIFGVIRTSSSLNGFFFQLVTIVIEKCVYIYIRVVLSLLRVTIYIRTLRNLSSSRMITTLSSRFYNAISGPPTVRTNILPHAHPHTVLSVRYFFILLTIFFSPQTSAYI